MSAPFVERERRRPVTSLRVLLGLGVALGLAALAGSLGLLLRVEHPWALVAALLLGHVAFGFSLALSHLNPRTGWVAAMASLRLLYRPYGGRTMLFYAQLALAEELLFRALPLSLLGGSWWLVLLLSAAFAFIHIGRPGRRAFPLMIAIELFILGIGLCLLFLWLGDLWPLVILHWVRNCCVAKTLVRKDRLQQRLGEEAAGAPERGVHCGSRRKPL